MKKRRNAKRRRMNRKRRTRRMRRRKRRRPLKKKQGRKRKTPNMRRRRRRSKRKRMIRKMLAILLRFPSRKITSSWLHPVPNSRKNSSRALKSCLLSKINNQSLP